LSANERKYTQINTKGVDAIRETDTNRFQFSDLANQPYCSKKIIRVDLRSFAD
jgi:hypothetical protein